jgi:formylglycine-generating enzyme required for sulfatase activity
VALVIGNSAYQHTRALPNPRNDAEAIAKLLRDNAFAEVTLKSDLDYRGMREAVRLFGDTARAADVALVYFAGHGLEVAGENYLVPVDAKLLRDVDLDYEAVSLGLVLNAVDGARKLKLVVLDACRNNPLGDRIALRAGRTRTVSRGLGRLDATGEVLVAYAAKAGTLAQDGAGRHSPYAEALLKHMATPGLDVIRMFGRVKEAVQAATNHGQEPWIYGSPGGDAVALVPAKGTADAKPIATPQPSAATEAARICREAEGMSNPATLAVLERQHKGTPAADCVAARIKQLQSVAAAVPKPDTVPPKAMEPAVAVTPDLTPGRTFRDCPDCPEMVVVPAGSFMMGLTAAEVEALVKEGKNKHYRSEGPQRRVTIARPFAVGKFEVTFAEWDACVAAGGCRHKPDDAGWGRGKRPVINVSWNHITQEYLPWLSRKTSRTYRLLSEAEWEYAARGATSASQPAKRYWWGDQASHEYANYGKDACCDGLKRGRDQWVNTAPVGQFPANPFGLHDMHGNALEWVEDCWSGSYSGAPSDGSAWTSGDCSSRVARGGSWSDDPQRLRSAMRIGNRPVDGGSIFGFRLARTLAP